MKNFKWWSVIAAAAAGVALSSCGSSSGSSDTVSLRVVNATLTHRSIDLLANATAIVTGTTADTVSTYAAPAAGSLVLQVNDTTTGLSLVTSSPSLTGGNHYALVAYESGGAVKTAVLAEDTTAPAANSAQIRVYDAAVSAGKVDVYVTDPNTDLATVGPSTSFTSISSAVSSSLLSLTASTAGTNYRVRVTGSGNKADLRLDIPLITLTSQQIVTVVLTPTSGGVLMNGSSLVQQGAYAATRNTNARVRLAAAVSGGAQVAASAGSTVIDAGSAAPAFGFYVLVPAANALNATVGGQSVQVSNASALTAGSDATLLVYGPSNAATASLVLDDNTLPTDATTVKLRLVNGVTGTVGAITLTANNSPVGIGVAGGAAAASYVSLALPTNSNTFNLILTSSVAGSLLNLNTNFNANTVYTVLAAGDVTAPQLLIR